MKPSSCAARSSVAALAELAELLAVAAEVALEQLGPDLEAAAALLDLDPVADALLRARGRDDLQPVLARGLAGRGDDLDRVAALQLVLERDELAVDARAGAVLADLRVDAVREVDDGRARREVEQVALRREGEDLLVEEVLLDRAHELLRVLEVLLPVQQLAQPGEALDLLRRAGLVLALVAPVRRDAGLGDPVHLVRPDLDLHALAEGADHGGVQRLVHVRLRHGDVVPEAAGHRLPVLVHDAERLVALARRVDEQAERDQVVDLVVEQVLRLHLLVDRVEVLRAGR